MNHNRATPSSHSQTVSYTFAPGQSYTIAYSGTTSGAPASVGSSVTFALATAAVPEPASWALMLAGFGMVGFAARRRTVTVAA
ncbi:FxDxF family PEP-CTERM protein [Polymorphobacter megasporae]|uniref:FxDxF family PEP-CTERM protein n=1 Tax=Glacieibacterium megasporae TaxID=2835787 RepID=UPI002107E756|nr:FxDxF family PEP-CTERM protein [Polymorphobacter megasporae]